MTTVLPAQCFACAHRHDRRSPTGTPLAATCTAFPTGIPAAMHYGADHRNPLPGDHGVRFEQADGEQATAAFQAWQQFTAASVR